jgi:hypothetical protein
MRMASTQVRRASQAAAAELSRETRLEPGAQVAADEAAKSAEQAEWPVRGDVAVGDQHEQGVAVVYFIEAAG